MFGMSFPLVVTAATYAVHGLFAVYVLMRPRSRQRSPMAWILFILLVPFAGILLYLVVGEVHFGSSRKQRHKEIHSNIRGVLRRAWEESPGKAPEVRKSFGSWVPVTLPPRLMSLAKLARLGSDTLPRGGNRVQLLTDTGGFLERLVRDIDDAREHVHLVTYIFLEDSVGRAVADALIRAEERGVECRVLADNVGSSDFLKSDMRRELVEAGVQVVAALPSRITHVAAIRFDMRNHRKIAVIDGRVGYTGSHNIAHEGFHPKPRFAPWVDATVRIEGPTVRDLQALFIEDWYMESSEHLDGLIVVRPEWHQDGRIVQVVGTGVHSRNQALVRVIQSAVHFASRELIMTTPYFVPDAGTVAAITTAAERGVRTAVVVPARNDSPLVALASRSFYQTLLNAGAEIHEYTKGLLHAKTITVDGEFAMVSTANLDRRSFEINFELSTLVYSPDFASELRTLQERYLTDCRRVEADEWKARPWPKRLAENVAGLFGPLL